VLFRSVVKSCGSIAGHVGGAGVVPVCGFVYSLGFDAFDCIDEAGNYQLKKVFKGHFRKVVAVYWVQVNGQLVKHREERTIDFFNGDLTGFDLPEGVQPTPTFPPPPNAYYDYFTGQIMEQKDIWQQELGLESGRQKTVDWLNNEVADFPLSSELAAVIKGAGMDKINSAAMWYNFKNGYEVIIMDDTLFSEDVTGVCYEETSSELQADYSPSLQSSGAPAFIKNTKVLMLGPKALELTIDTGHKMFDPTNSLVFAFEKKGFEVTPKAILECDASGEGLSHNGIDPVQVEFGVDPNFPQDLPGDLVLECKIKDGMRNTVIRPSDFLGMDNYGVIFITAHAFEDAIMVCPRYRNDPDLDSWLAANQFYNRNRDNPAVPGPGTWCEVFAPCSVLRVSSHFAQKVPYYRGIGLSHDFFANNYSEGDFNGSLVFVCACSSWDFVDIKGENASLPSPRPFSGADYFLGYHGLYDFRNVGRFPYDFFCYMLGVNPEDIYDDTPTPRSAEWSDFWLYRFVYSLGGEWKDLKEYSKYGNTFLPGVVDITVEENNL